MSSYDLDAIRKRLKEKNQKRQKDVNEFQPKKAESKSEADVYRFYILPPVEEDEKVAGGKASRSMSDFYVPYGQHWHNKRPTPCIRLWDETECPVCQMGFDLAKDLTDKKEKANIYRAWLPNPVYYVNIFFPDNPNLKNPEEYRGRVMYYPAPKSVFDIMYAALFRDSHGDDNAPQGYGVFFNPEKAILFSLNVKKADGTSDDGRSYNDYKSSQFIVPMVGDDENKRPNLGPIIKGGEANIQAILDKRHDIYSRLEEPEMAKLEKLVKTMIDGTGGGGFDGGDAEEDEKPASKPPASKAPASSSSASAPAVSSGTAKAGKLKEPVNENVEEPSDEKSKGEETSEPATSDGGADEDINNILARLRKKSG